MRQHIDRRVGIDIEDGDDRHKNKLEVKTENFRNENDCTYIHLRYTRTLYFDCRKEKKKRKKRAFSFEVQINMTKYLFTLFCLSGSPRTFFFFTLFSLSYLLLFLPIIFFRLETDRTT